MTFTLRVNPIACTGHGACAEVAPELIEADEWGYPIPDAGPVPGHLERTARKAVAACPTLALRLQPATGDSGDATERAHHRRDGQSQKKPKTRA